MYKLKLISLLIVLAASSASAMETITSIFGSGNSTTTQSTLATNTVKRLEQRNVAKYTKLMLKEATDFSASTQEVEDTIVRANYYSLLQKACSEGANCSIKESDLRAKMVTIQQTIKQQRVDSATAVAGVSLGVCLTGLSCCCCPCFFSSKEEE